MKLGLILALCLVGTAALADDDEAMGRRVQALLRAHQADVFGCVAKQSGDVAGEALLRVVVGDEGKAARVEVLKVEQGKPAARAAADCVAQAARGWSLSSLSAEKGDQVVFPLAFKPADPDASAIGARVQLLTLRANSERRLKIEFPTVFYILGPGVPSIKMSDGVVHTGAVGDVVYTTTGATLSIHAKASSTLLQIDAPNYLHHGDAGSGFGWISKADKTPLPLFGGRGEVKLLLDGTSAPFAVDHLCAKKGVVVPPHVHATSDEIIYIISGSARTTFAGEQHLDKAGDLTSIPRGTQHGLEVVDDLCAVQVYAPPGPEQRFKP